MEFELLGPVRVVGDQGPLQITGAKRRALLAILLLRAGSAVSIPRLVNGIWPDGPPQSVIFNVRTYVHNLRQLLERAGDSPNRLARHPAGYHLAVEPDELDVLRFQRLVDDGHRAMKRDDLPAAIERFDGGLRLWQGRPLEDLPGLGPEVAAEATVLEEQRWAAVSSLIEARLRLGQHDELVPWLRQLVAERPLDERTRAQMITALSRAGRTAEALAAFREARETVIDELGVEPGAALQDAHFAVLNGDVPDPRDAAKLAQATAPAPADVTAVSVPRALPMRPPDFIGRVALLGQLRRIGELVAAGAAGDGHAAVVSISGCPGVGKSTLAVAAGYELSELYPDGQLFVGLDGCTGQPRRPADTLAELLSALNVAPSTIPDGLRERMSMFRSTVAGRRLLLILDDAQSARDVTQLLPGSGRSLVLVTSRRRLPDLEVRNRFNLGPLDQREALEMLASTITADRVQASPEAARRITAACESLPLALRIVGARLSTRPGTTLGVYAARLEDERARIDELTIGDISVSERLLQSCRALDSRARTALHRLGRATHRPFTEGVAGDVLDLPRTDVFQLVDSLVQDNLLTPLDGAGDQHYDMSPLLRVYLRGCEESTLSPELIR